MASDNLRREVAQKLRELEVGDFPDGRFYDRGEVETALGIIDYGSWYKEADVQRLADLIDRPKAKREDAGNYWLCKHCGSFSRKDAVTDCCGVIPSRCCGNCGREWER